MISEVLNRHSSVYTSYVPLPCWRVGLIANSALAKLLVAKDTRYANRKNFIMTQSNSVVTLSHITYTYPGTSNPALANVSATFSRGWTGIIGNNGCGKSTLARIACGIITPELGSVTPLLTFAYCEQDAGNEPSMLFNFACDYSPTAQHLRSILNIKDDMLWRFAELSSGEQKKIQVATALWMEPELLVLDEPTNHVDAVCRAEIQEALATYKGIGLLISHDRTLLDALASNCLCFEGSQAVMRPGGYSQAKAQAQQDILTATRTKEAQKAKVQKLQAEYAQRANKASQTASRRSARNLDKHDRDGRAKIKLAIYTGQDGKAGSLAANMDARLAKEQDKLVGMFIAKEYNSTLWLEASPSPRKTLLHLPAHTMTTPQGETRSIPTITLENTTHLGIRGPNGIGKTTLINELLQVLQNQAEQAPLRILYLPQELSESDRKTLLAKITALPKEEKGKLLSIVAQLNSDPKRILSGASTSPGEARKLFLAYGIMNAPELIIMDEPTNHLDLHSIEALEQALANFPGALVLVSHDEAFMKSTTTEAIELK